MRKRTMFALIVVASALILGNIFFAQTNARAAQFAQNGATKKKINIDSSLGDLQQEWITHQNSGNQEPFTPSDPIIPVVEEDYVVIDAVAAGDPDQLRLLLEAEGMRQATVFGRIVSGQFPIEKIDGLIDEVELKIMRPAYALSNVGLVDSQGDVAMNSNIARSTFGVDGTGITIGTLSDSYDCATAPTTNAATDVANGDLPAGIQVLDDTSCPGSDEGRAMMQLIADVAPGADQAFHTAFNGQADFASGILELQSVAGADIIVDDIFYFAEPFFQDGIVAQAVDQVVALGVPYFSSAGNSARDSYESAFVNSSQPTIFPFAGGIPHDFDPGLGVDTRQRVTIPSGATTFISLQWDQPFFSVSGGAGSTNDLDVAILDTAGNIVASSTTNNIGGDPVEIIVFTNSTGSSSFDIVIEKYGPSGGPDPTLIKYIAFRSLTINEYDTASSTVVGHSNAESAEAVGAAYYQQTPPFGVTPPLLEPFSSGGKTPILFDLAGNPVFIDRDKPEIVAPDGTDTTFFGSDSDGNGFPNFFGTSAAAPHAAAAAALMLEANNTLTPADVYSTLEMTALDMDVPGFDLDTGYGLIQVDAAVGAVVGGPPARIFISPSNPANVGFNYYDEDIIVHNGTSWSMFFDGSDVGLGGAPDLNAFHILDDGNLLLSFDAPVNLGGTLYDDSDILLFTVTSLGTVTSGTFSMYFDGSANGFDTIGEDIDAITMNAAGELVLSTLGSAQIPRPPFPDLTQQDDDLARRRASDGLWLRYFDGSDVGLTINTEDVWGAQVNPDTGVVYLTTLDAFVATGLSGDGNDIFTCTPGTLGNNTSCPLDLYWDGDLFGLTGERIDALAIIEDTTVSAASMSLTTANDPRDSVSIAGEDEGYDDVEDHLEDLNDTLGAPSVEPQMFLPFMQMR